MRAIQQEYRKMDRSNAVTRDRLVNPVYQVTQQEQRVTQQEQRVTQQEQRVTQQEQRVTQQEHRVTQPEQWLPASDCRACICECMSEFTVNYTGYSQASVLDYRNETDQYSCEYCSSAYQSDMSYSGASTSDYIMNMSEHVSDQDKCNCAVTLRI